MKRSLCVLLLTLLVESTAWATWSIVAVDRNTGRVVIASATCAASTTPDRLKVLQAVVVPGKGIAACQAGVDPTHRNHTVVFEGLQNGTHPIEIIRMLESDPDIERRQFGIVDLQGRSAGRSGSGNGQVSLDVQGEVPGANIFYSVQGNSIARPEAMIEAARVLAETPGPITDRVMAGMEKADSLGGDRRCTCTANLSPVRRILERRRMWPTSWRPIRTTRSALMWAIPQTTGASPGTTRTTRCSSRSSRRHYRTKTVTRSGRFACVTTRGGPKTRLW